VNFKPILEAYKGQSRADLSAWRESYAGQQILREANRQRQLALRFLLGAALESTDPKVTKYAAQYKELSELVVFFAGADPDERTADEGGGDEPGPGSKKKG
jgi:hypothetical protein